MITSCPSGRSVCFITMPLAVLSVWKHFHRLLKTTCLGCWIKINNCDFDSQQKYASPNPEVLTGTSVHSVASTLNSKKTLNVFEKNGVKG